MRTILTIGALLLTATACESDSVRTISDEPSEVPNEAILELVWDTMSMPDQEFICVGLDEYGYEFGYENFIEGAESDLVTFGEFSDFFQGKC